MRNYYRHQEVLDEIEDASHPSDLKMTSARKRRLIKNELNKYPFQMDKSVKQDLWQVKFLQRSKTSDKIRDMELDANRARLDRILKQKVSRLYKDEAQEAQKALSILDAEFVKERFKDLIGSRLHSDGKTNR